MNYFILLISFLLQKIECKLEHLELMNVKSFKLQNELKQKYSTLIKESNGQKSLLSRLNPFESKIKPEPQKDFEELVQIYGAMNSADTATLYFLSKECRVDGLLEPKTDPILCENYPKNLIKQIQNRIFTINSKIIKSQNHLKCPTHWVHHAVTVESLLKDIDPKNLLEYRISSAITSVLMPEGWGKEAGGGGASASNKNEEARLEEEYQNQISKAEDELKIESHDGHIEIGDKSIESHSEPISKLSTKSEINQPSSSPLNLPSIEPLNSPLNEPLNSPLNEPLNSPQSKPSENNETSSLNPQPPVHYQSGKILDNIMKQMGEQTSGTNFSFQLQV